MASFVLNLLDQIAPILGILGAQADLCDLNEVRGELLCVVPMGKDVGHLGAIHAPNSLHEVIALGKDLLDAVLDAVVDCFDEVS